MAIANHPCECQWHNGRPYCFPPPRSHTPQALTPAFLVNADVEPIKSVPCAIFLGTEDAMMDMKSLDQVEEIMKKSLGDDKLLVQRFPGA